MELRNHYGNHVLGTYCETLVGGNNWHLRLWRQIRPERAQNVHTDVPFLAYVNQHILIYSLAKLLRIVFCL